MRKIASPRGWLFVLFLVPFLVASLASAQDKEETALKNRVMREFPDALARLEALYSQVSVSGTLTELRRFRNPADGSVVLSKDARPSSAEHTVADLESTSSRRVVMEVSNDLKKYSQVVVFDKYYDKNSHSLRDREISPVSPSRSVACLGRNYSFRLRWEKGNPIISSFGAKNDEDPNAILMIRLDRFLRAPCGYFFPGLSMSQMMAFPSFSIRQ
jgi:hypothetical protein